MSPKNYPRQVHFSPTWNPGSSTTTGATTNTGHSVTTPAANTPVTTPVLSTPVVAAPATSATTPATTSQIVVQTSQTPSATVAEVPAAAVPKPNTTANTPTFGTKAGTMSSSAISPTSSATADSGSNGTTIAIIGGSVVVGVVILACAAVAWLRRRKARKDRDANNLEFDRHAAMRQSTIIPDEPTPAPSVAPTQPMIDRHYNTPAVTYGYNVQPSYQGGPPQQAYQSQYAPGQVLFNAPMSGYATPSGYASGYATPGGAPATNLPSTQYAERAYTGPTGQPGSPMEQQHHQYAEHEPVRRTSAGAYSNMSRHNSNEFQQQQYADIERSLHGHDDDPHAPAPASPSPFGDQAQAPPSPRPGMTQQVPPPVHPAVAAHHDAHPQAPGAAPAARGGAPAQRPQSTYDDDDAYGGM